MKYLDFDLIIERSGDAYTARVFNSPAGQATAAFREPFSDLEIENFLLRVGRSRHAVRRIESPEMASAKAFGGKLFNEVFAGDVRGCLRSSIDEAEPAGRRAARAAAPRPGAGACRPSLGVSLQRRDEPVPRALGRDAGRALPGAARAHPPARREAAASRPDDDSRARRTTPQLDVDREFAKMNEALSDLEQRGLVTVERQETATLSELQRRLRQSEYHIFHFVGHGGFDEHADDGLLMLEDAEERGRRVSAQFIGTLLHDHRPLRLAVLNACEGARASRADPFAGTAQSLVQQGMPAVIAMQFEVTDEAAICFTREFYSALAAGYPVDAALAEARKAIFAEVQRDRMGHARALHARAGRPHLRGRAGQRAGSETAAAIVAAGRGADGGSGRRRADGHRQAQSAPRDRSHTRRGDDASSRDQPPAAAGEHVHRSARRVRRRTVARGGRRPEEDRGHRSRTYKDVDALLGLAEKALARANEEDGRRRRAAELRRAATSAMDKERWDEAVEHWQTLAAVDPENETVRAQLAEARRQKELNALYLSARAHYDKRNWPDALGELERLQKIAPDYKEVPALLANIDRVLHRGPSIGTAAAKLQSLRGGPDLQTPAPPPPQAAAPRAAVDAPPRSTAVPRAKWFVLGSALGGLVALVIALVIIGIVIVALKKDRGEVSTVPPPAGVEKEVARQPPVSDPVPSRPRPSAPPAASTAPVSINPARMVTAPAETQTELANAVASGSQAEILAYRIANPQPLRSVYTGRLLALHEQQLQQLAAAGMTAANNLSNRQFRSFRVSGDGRRAEVDMIERWSTNFMLGLVCVNHVHDHDVPQTVFLERQGVGWMAYDTAQNEPEPVLVPCHN